jgi:transcriptional regulator with XRE-family HTH domain
MFAYVDTAAAMPRGFSNPATAEKISKRLVLLRKVLGHTQESLADRLEIGRSQLANYEASDPERVITVSVALSLCQISGASLDWIYTGNEFYLSSELKENLRVQEKLLIEKAKQRQRRRPRDAARR